MRIFVTGATGFIGSHLVPLLRERGHALALFNRRDWNHLESILSEFQPEVAIHLAWEGLPDYSWPMCAKNVELGLRVYDALSKSNCRKIITTGSCWEYGDSNSFVAAKTALRLMGESLAKERNAAFIWARLFFVYGRGQRETSLIPSVFKKIKNKQTPEIKNPNAVHDFIYVKDVVKALTLLAEAKVGASTVDIGSGQLYSVGDVTQSVVKILQKEPVEMKPVSISNVFRADLSNLKKLGWKADYDLMAGIRETLSCHCEESRRRRDDEAISI